MNPTVKKDLARIFGSVTNRDHYTVVRDFFELCAISVRNAVDHGNSHGTLEKRYRDVAATYTREQLENFSRGFGILATEMNRAVQGDTEFCDWAGELYMESGTSNSKAGQFFTPYSVSRIMASVNLEREEVMGKFAGDPDHVLTVYEPTCGAGGLVVASVDVLRSYGVNYSWNCFVDCGDIDPRCVHMTYLTLSLLGVPAVVRLGDALKMEYSQAWFTPAYIFAWPHFRARIGRGNYPRRPTVPEEPGPVRAEETPEPSPVTAPGPVPKMDENGQYSLF